jgi:hypothetical protein
VAVDHRALHAELAHGALELVRRRARVGRRQRGEGREAFGVLVHGAGELVVGLAREGHGGLGVVEVLDARRRVADDLQVDAGGVHGRQPLLAEIEQVGRQRRRRCGGVGIAQGPDGLGDGGGPEVLFQGDDAHAAHLRGPLDSAASRSRGPQPRRLACVVA